MLALILALSVLVSCGGVADSGTALVRIGAPNSEGVYEYTDYAVELSRLGDKSLGAVSLLDYIKEENDGFDYSITEGLYGAYIESVGGLLPSSGKGEYIAIYTSEKADATTGMDEPVTIDGSIYYYSGVGISSMTVNDGTVILLRLESY